METDVHILAIWQVAIGYVFVLLLLAILRWRGIRREKLLVLATLRMTVQLVLVGYVILFVIEEAHPLITFAIILVMLAFAIHTIIRKFKDDMRPSLKRVVAVSMTLGTLPVLAYFLWAVIQVRPYYDPQYVIPITGMIIGNSMTGISLGVQTMVKRFKRGKAEIEELLILGATPKQASASIVNDAFDAAILPTLNSMLGMGIIFLPGMMTGQILSGVDPTMAILYQIVVMLGILGGVSMTTYVFLLLGHKTFFNNAQQLIG